MPYRTADDAQVGAIPALPSIRDVPSWGLFGGGHLFPALGRVLPALGGGSDGAATGERRGAPDRDGRRTRRALRLCRRPPLQFATQRTYLLRDVPDEVRLALEMVAHEETERRALEGELELLERQWRRAEAVAAIADQLATGVDPA